MQQFMFVFGTDGDVVCIFPSMYVCIFVFLCARVYELRLGWLDCVVEDVIYYNLCAV